MCAHIFFRLSLSLFYTKVLNISNITPFTLTILTLCVIIFLKTVIIFISTIYALKFHWFHKTLYISKIQTHQSNLQIVTADFFAIPVIIFSPITTALISHFRAANAIADWYFPQMNHPLSEHFHAIFSQENPITSCFWGAWLHQSSIVCCVLRTFFIQKRR